jgi:hypothetical protein
VNSASPPNLSIQFQRSRGNQPDPTFPQSPGIIFETNSSIFQSSLSDTCSRCYTRIAPWLTSSACVAHGLLRAQHFSAPHHAQIALRPILGLPRRSRIAPFLAFPALCCQRIAPLFSTARVLAPGSDCSSPDSRVSHRSRIASRSTLGLPHRARLSPCGLLRARCFPPCAARGSLRRHRLALAPGTNYFVLDTWPSAPCSVLSLRIAPCSLLPALRCPRIAPLASLNTNCLAQTSLRSTVSARTVP